MNDKKNVGPDLHTEWFGLLSDEAKADVMKTQIAEHEKTERERITQAGETQRNLESNSDYHFIRGMFVVFLLSVVAGTTCVGARRIDLEDQRIREASRIIVPRPAQSASSVPVVTQQPDAGR